MLRFVPGGVYHVSRDDVPSRRPVRDIGCGFLMYFDIVVKRIAGTSSSSRWEDSYQGAPLKITYPVIV